MAWERWDKHPNGDLRLGPLMGWDIGILPMTGLFRFETATSEEKLLCGEFEALQVGMTVAQMRELASALLRTADTVEGQPPGTKQ